MKTIRLNDSGPAVKRWQYFLIGQALYFGTADGVFGKNTHEATKAFQRKYKLKADGIVGNKTYGQAMVLGFEGVPYPAGDPDLQPDFPPRPAFNALSQSQKQTMFGRIEFVHTPVASNPEAIRITNGWDKVHIVRIEVPQLAGVKGAPADGTIRFHKAAKQQLLALWDAWEKKGLLPLVLSYAGSYVPRLVRGGTSLSSHAHGTAFDINVPWNRLGTIPALVGSKGSVRELVPIAHEHGFFWGGHFTRYDGMHFEIAELKS